VAYCTGLELFSRFVGSERNSTYDRIIIILSIGTFPSDNSRRSYFSRVFVARDSCSDLSDTRFVLHASCTVCLRNIFARALVFDMFKVYVMTYVNKNGWFKNQLS